MEGVPAPKPPPNTSRKRKSVSWQRPYDGNGYQQGLSGHQNQWFSKRSKRNKRMRQAKKQLQEQGGDYGPVPSLSALRHANRQRARQYFRRVSGFENESFLAAPLSVPRTTPRTVPRAPENTTSFLIEEHRSSPNQQLALAHEQQLGNLGNWTGNGLLDEDAALLGADLDFFGTNEGLIRPTRRESPAHSHDGESDFSSDETSDDEDGDNVVPGYELHFAQQPGNVAEVRELPSAVVARLEEQATYIAQLEDENLNLRERVFLLQQELQDLRREGRVLQSSEEEVAVSDDEVGGHSAHCAPVASMLEPSASLVEPSAAG